MRDYPLNELRVEEVQTGLRWPHSLGCSLRDSVFPRSTSYYHWRKLPVSSTRFQKARYWLDRFHW